MLPTPVVKAALLFIAKDNLRVYLTGLHILVESGDVTIEASDGKTFFQHTIADYAGIDDIDLIIPNYIVKLAASRVNKKTPTIILDVDEHFIGDVGFKPLEVMYPEFKPVALFKGTQDQETTFDLGYLYRLQKACDVMGGPFMALPKIEFYETCAALHIDDNTVAVAMSAKTDLGVSP